MDRELAGVVLEKWETGEPVSEIQLYKAAEALDIDPVAALVEARFYTYFDKCVLEKRAMSRGERIVFSAAAGINDTTMVKSASAFGLSPDELIYEALRDRGFVPDLQKISSLPRNIPQREAFTNKVRSKDYPSHRVDAHLQGRAVAEMMSGPHPMTLETSSLVDHVLSGAKKSKALARASLSKMANIGMVTPGAQRQSSTQADTTPPSPEQAAGDIMMAPPSPDAMLQQQPSARVKPSPTGPDQVAASPAGNLDELIQQGQQVYGDQAMDNGGTAPQGMPEPAPPPPSPEERIKQVGPNLDDETIARYAEQLQRFEEGFQMPINDPKQMVKFVKELQKVDGKKVDQGIKAMGQQLEQEQAQELGVDATPTIDGPGGSMGGGPGTKMAPKSQDGQVGPISDSQQNPMGPQSGGGDQSDQQKKLPPQTGSPRQPSKTAPQQSVEAAVEKVANAARALARASFR